MVASVDENRHASSAVPHNPWHDSNSTVGGNDSHISPCTVAISIQSFLNQLSHPRIKADFNNKKFGCNINPNLLPKLDELMWCLLPHWQGGSLTAATSIRADHHMQQLNAQNDSLLLTVMDNISACVSYNE